MTQYLENSDLNYNQIETTPSTLLCSCCLHGGASFILADREDVNKLLCAIRNDPNVHIYLRTAFDDVGARTKMYAETTPSQRKRDLDIFREMGSIPEVVRTAQVWTELLSEYIPHPKPICAPYLQESENWINCPNAEKDYYQVGLKELCQKRSEKEMSCAKSSSCEKMLKDEMLSVRAHHLLCMICFVGSIHSQEPLAEDNLYELWHRILNQPDLPILIEEGPGNCCVCPPCYAYNPNSGLCIISSSLRDRKKDLDVCSKLNIIPGQILSAKEIMQRIYRHIKNVNGICFFEERRGFEWRNCKTHMCGTYEKGLTIVTTALAF